MGTVPKVTVQFSELDIMEVLDHVIDDLLAIKATYSCQMFW